MKNKFFTNPIVEIVITSNEAIETAFIDGSPGYSEGMDGETKVLD